MATGRIPNQEMHRIATTAIIFRDDDRVLITKRAEHKKVWPGKWTVPGGGFETDDYTTRAPTHIGSTVQWYNSLVTAVSREVYEETKLLIKNLQLVCDLTFIRPDAIPVLVLSYSADLNGPDVITLDKDATEYEWVNLQEAKNFDLIDGIHHELQLAFMKRGLVA